MFCRFLFIRPSRPFKVNDLPKRLSTTGSAVDVFVGCLLCRRTISYALLFSRTTFTNNASSLHKSLLSQKPILMFSESRPNFNRASFLKFVIIVFFFQFANIGCTPRRKMIRRRRERNRSHHQNRRKRAVKHRKLQQQPQQQIRQVGESEKFICV